MAYERRSSPAPPFQQKRYVIPGGGARVGSDPWFDCSWCGTWFTPHETGCCPYCEAYCEARAALYLPMSNTTIH